LEKTLSTLSITAYTRCEAGFSLLGFPLRSFVGIMGRKIDKRNSEEKKILKGANKRSRYFLTASS
jgi:hypothetical protein